MNSLRRALISVLTLVVCLASAGSRAGQAAAEILPAQLSDRDYWRLITETSEPDGYFRSENLVSNERTYQYVLPDLLKTAKPGGVYLGVAPDQNFTYIVALRPKMAFIVDIRRGNLLEHLMYKALFELSADRAEFLARLFSRARPAGVGAESTTKQLFDAVVAAEPRDALFQQNLTAMRDLLVGQHQFPLSDEDLEQLATIYAQFFHEGPDLRYTALPSFVMNQFGNNGVRVMGFGGLMPDFPSYQELQEATDPMGRNRSYLGSEANYQFLKSFEARNLLVPIVGDFAGPKAIRRVGDYIRAHGETVTAFYVSNVEQYLMQDGIFPAFAANVATLPADTHSTFIRSVWSRFGYQGTLLGPDGRGSALDPLRLFVRDAQAGKIRSYVDLNVRAR